jgi:hypothetical protein
MKYEYTRHTGRIFSTRRKEHIRAIHNNNNQCGYSDRVLNTRQTHTHTHGNLTNTQDVLQRGKHLNRLERYHTYSNVHIMIPTQTHTGRCSKSYLNERPPDNSYLACVQLMKSSIQQNTHSSYSSANTNRHSFLYLRVKVKLSL